MIYTDTVMLEYYAAFKINIFEKIISTGKNAQSAVGIQNNRVKPHIIGL